MKTVRAQRQQQGHVTKCGNPRLRWALCELAWRLLKFQPDYRLCQKWRAQIIDPQTPGGRKKQLVVALARGFGVDWWRLRTGQTTPEKLGPGDDRLKTLNPGLNDLNLMN